MRTAAHVALLQAPCMCAYRKVCPQLFTPFVSQACPSFKHTKQHTQHTHTRSNRWLILTEIIRQQSHQHGSVVIRVWTQCLFCGRNGRSAWPVSVEMHYSLRCPDLIQRHKVACSSHFASSLNISASVIFSAFHCGLLQCQKHTSLAQSCSKELAKRMPTSQVCHVDCCW